MKDQSAPQWMRRSTVDLTHYGRRSGRPYRVKVWFSVLDERVWIGSLDARRAWVKNVEANGRAALDFGDGPRDCHLSVVEDAGAIERFERTMRRRHPVLGPLLSLFVRGPRRVFATTERVSELRL